MDKQNFDSIVNRYLDKFEYTNGKGPEEYFKWKAIDCFQTNWNIDAEDLYTTFSKAIGKTSVLLDGGHASPSSGIKALLKMPEEVEFVREAFKMLFNMSGDLKQRDQQVHHFIHDVNSKIGKYWPNDGYKPQSSRAALCYLALAHPEENFFYMFQKAENWAVFTEYGWDLGAGAYFSLPIYYQMCEELVEAIRSNPQLQECDRKRKERARVDLEDNYHTLAYDIIYCATTYHLFSDLPIFYPTNVKSRIQRSKEREEISELRQKVLSAEKALEENETVGWMTPDLVGHSVIHKKYGEGTVVEQAEKLLKARFGNEVKSFGYPEAFVLKHLVPSDADLLAVQTSEQARKEHERLEKELKYAKEEYEKKTVKFEKSWKKSVHNDAVDEGED